MKRALIVVVGVVGVAAVLAIAMFEAMNGAAPRAAKQQWPAGLGTIDDVPSRYPVHNAPTPAATKLVDLAMPLGVDIAPREGRRGPRDFPERPSYQAIKEPLSIYIERQLSRPNDHVDPPPQAVAQYLENHRAALDAVRAHLLAEQPIAWKVQLVHDAPLPNLLGHMELLKVLIADALAKNSWDDLHAVWLLDRSLMSRPDLISQVIALAMSRMTNAAAAKMPLPPPAWFAELESVDMQRPVLASIQAESWWLLHNDSAVVRFCAADAAERTRSEVASMIGSAACDVDAEARHREFEKSLPKWNILGAAILDVWSVWQRVQRFTPEREATGKILQLRSGETPSSQSRCSDGNWLVTPNSLKFSCNIPVKVGTKYPLEYVSDARQ